PPGSTPRRARASGRRSPHALGTDWRNTHLRPMLDGRDVMPGHYSFTLLVLPLIATAAITLGLGLYALRKRRIAGAGTFAVVMFGVVEWSLCYALVLAGTER